MGSTHRDIIPSEHLQSTSTRTVAGSFHADTCPATDASSRSPMAWTTASNVQSPKVGFSPDVTDARPIGVPTLYAVDTHSGPGFGPLTLNLNIEAADHHHPRLSTVCRPRAVAVANVPDSPALSRKCKRVPLNGTGITFSADVNISRALRYEPNVGDGGGGGGGFLSSASSMTFDDLTYVIIIRTQDTYFE